MIDKTLLENCFYYAEKTMNSNCALEDKLEITKLHLSSGREALKYTEGFSFSEYERLEKVIDGFITEIDSVVVQLKETPKFTFCGNIVNTEHSMYICEDTVKINKISESLTVFNTSVTEKNSYF